VNKYMVYKSIVYSASYGTQLEFDIDMLLRCCNKHNTFELD